MNFYKAKNQNSFKLTAFLTFILFLIFFSQFSFIFTSIARAGAIGQWNSNLGIALTTAANNQTETKIVSDGNGGAIIAWFDATDSRHKAQRIDSSGNPLWTAGGVDVVQRVGSGYYENMIADGSGGMIFVSGTVAQKLNSSGVKQWGTGVNVFGSLTGCYSIGGGLQQNIVPDGSGGVMAACSRGITNEDIYVQRLNSFGVQQWGATGLQITSSGTIRDIYFNLSTDNSNNLYATWEASGATRAVLVQKISNAGVVQWTAGGVSVDTGNTSLTNSFVSGDATGGAFVLWNQDKGSGTTVRYQKLNSSGVAQLTANGVSLGAGVGIPTTLIHDDAGGAIGVYSGKITRFDSAGSVLWTVGASARRVVIANQSIYMVGSGATSLGIQRYSLTDGATLSNNLSQMNGSSNAAGTPDLIYPSNDGSIFVTWSENRSGNSDPFVNKYLFLNRITAVPAGYAVTNPNGDNIVVPSTFGEDTNNVVLTAQIASSYTFPSFKASVDMTADRNWSTFQYSASTIDYFAYSTGIQSLPGVIGGQYTMYVPRRIDDDLIIVCPNTTTLNAIVSGCSGFISLNPSSPNVASVNLGGVDLWEISGLTQSVGIKSTKSPTTITDNFLITPNPATLYNGLSGNFTVTARNSNNSTNNIYIGTVSFTTDGTATLPADYTFTESDNGVATFSITFNGTGNFTLTVTDTVTTSATGSASVSVIDSPGKNLDNLLNFDFRIDGDGEDFCLSCWDNVIAVGDVNGDSIDDIVMHGYENLGSDDIIYVVFGSSIPRAQVTTLTDSSSYNLRIEPDIVNDGFYLYGIRIEDVNNDGFGDLILSSSDSSYTNSYSGSTFVIYSTLLDDYTGTGNVMALDNPANFNFRVDGNTDDSLGASEGWPLFKDFNGDNVKDFIATSYSTAVYFVDSSHFLGFGSSTGNVIDLANPSNYEIKIFSTNSPSNLGRFTGVFNNIVIDDVTGDGDIDFLVADRAFSNYRGGVYFIDSSIIQTWSGTGNDIDITNTLNYTGLIQNSALNASSYLSSIFAADFNSDGLKDLLVDSNFAYGAGGYILFSNLLGSFIGTGNSIDLNNSSNFNLRFDTDFSTARARIGPVSAGTDWSNDGNTDLVVSAVNDSYNGVTGVIYVLFSTLIDDIGTTTGNIWDLSDSNYSVVITPELSGQEFHSNASYKTVDWNNDSFPDLMVTSSQADFGGTDTGSIYIVSGQLIAAAALGNIPVELSMTNSNNFLSRFDGAFDGMYLNEWGQNFEGDFNGDGLNDLIFGNYNTSYNGNSSGSVYIILGEAPPPTGFNIINLQNPLSARLASDNSTDVSITEQNGLTDLRLFYSANLLADITANFTSNLNWATVAGEVNLLDKKSYIHNLIGAPGAGASYSLYIPKAANDDRVYICPDATSLAAVTTNCSNGYELQDSDSNVSIITYQSSDYWQVDNLTGTGGISYQYIPPPPVGYIITNLQSPLTVRLLSNNTIDLAVTPQTGIVNSRLLKSAIPIADISVNFSANRNWGSVVGDSDSISKKAYVHNLIGAPGAGASYSLYIPKAANDDRVYICPDATSLAAVTTNCSNGYDRSVSDSGISLVTYLSNEYWKIDNLTGTGGLSYQYSAPVNNQNPPPPTPPVVNTGNQDSDNDGLTNNEESALGTNSNDSDTDNDGILDGEEVDGCLYIPESINCSTTTFPPTNPNDADSDNDGLLDGEEILGCLFLADTINCSGTTFLPTNPTDPLSFYVPPSGNSNQSPVSAPVVSVTPISGNTNTDNNSNSNSNPDIISGVVEGVGNVVNSVTNLVSSLVTRPVETVQTAAQNGVLPTVAVVSTTSAATLTAVSYPNIFSYVFLWVKKRKKYSPWGMVYDSITNKPIAFATVRLKTLSGEFVKDAVSDLNGKYTLNVEVGTYLLNAKVDGYHEFNKQVESKSESFTYEIALESKTESGFNVKKTIKENIGKLNSIIFYLGLSFSALTVIFAPSLIHFVILSIFVVQSLFFIKLGTTKSGSIFDIKTKTKLKGIFIKIYEESGRQLGSAISDQKGKYTILLSKGKYYVKVESNNYKIADGVTQFKDALGNPYIEVEIVKDDLLNLSVPMEMKSSSELTTTSNTKFGFMG